MNNNEISNLIKELIQRTTVSLNNIEVKEEDVKSGGKATWFKVEVGEPHLFLDRGAEALQALNHIVRKIIESKNPGAEAEKENIMIDINEYQAKRIENIHAVAHMMAERARYFKSNIEMEPQSPFDRRIVHEFLSDAQDLKTESIGAGPTRRVVIKYIGTSDSII